MRFLTFVFFSILIVTAAPAAHAQTEPADSTIANAMKDLDRLEQQAAGLSPSRSSGAGRLQKLLELTANRLQSSANKDHPSWQAANERIAALNQRLDDIASGKGAASAPAPVQAAPPQAAPQQAAPAQPAPAAARDDGAEASDERMKKALTRMRELEVGAERVTPGTPDAAIEIVKQLNEFPKMVGTKEDQAHARWPELVDRHGKLKSAMLTLATGAYAQRMANKAADMTRALRSTDPAEVRKAEIAQRWRQTLADGREQMSTLPDQKHPNVAALAGAFDDMEKALEEKLAFVAKPPVTIDNIWNAEWPMDEPVLIDTIGPIETTVLVQMHVGRPAKWVPEPTLLVRFPQHASDDVIVMQVFDGRKEIGRPMTCGAPAFVKSLALALFTCRPGADFGMAESGTFKLKLTYRQTLRGKEHELADLTLPVAELKHGARNNPEIVFGDSMDARMNVSTIEEFGGTGEPILRIELVSAGKFGREGLNALISAHDDPASIPHAMIRTWFKAGKNMIPTKITCFKDDKVVGEADHSSHDTRGTWTYGDAGQEYETWVRAHYELYSMVFRPRYGGDKGGFESGNFFFLSENPGEYRCVVSGNGEVLKELYFTIGGDGLIEKPACQAKSMKTLRHLTLLRQVNKKIAFVPYDEDAGEDRGFFGNAEWARGCPPAQ